MNKKVVIVHNIISPHVLPVFQELANKLDLTVLFCAEREDNRNWNVKPMGFNYKVLPNKSIKFSGKDLFTYFINPSIYKELAKINPDIVIVCGWDLFAYQVSFLYCKIFKKKFVLWSGSTNNESSWRRIVSLPFVWLMVKGSDAFITYGSLSKKYLELLGAPKNKIAISYNTTDVKKYSKLTNKYRKEKLKIKNDLGCNTKQIVMYYGQLIERKGVDILIKAFNSLKTNSASLLIVGSGPEKEKLIDLTNGNKNIVFRDDPGDEEVCQYYAISDIFVLPSREEVWGLVINQAMAAGLPITVSDIAGGSYDLVQDGQNGYIFQKDDVEDLGNKMDVILNDKNLRSKMASKSLEIIKNFTPSKVAINIIDLVKSMQN